MENIGRKKITLDDVRRETYSNREYGDLAAARAMAYLMDGEKEKRLGQQLCKYCFNFRSSGMYGQAFTTVNCRYCDEEMTFSSTRTDKLCKPCAKKLDLCVFCAGDIEMIMRHKLEKKDTK